MNLQKMRDIDWEHEVMRIYEKYSSRLVFGDQDIINIFFHFHPDKLLQLPCEYNYRPDHCLYADDCEAEAFKILHGNRGYFHKAVNQNQPIFSEIYDAFQKVSFKIMLKILK